MIVARNLFLSFFVATSALAGTYSITTNADSGPGSLRQAILDANSGACAAPCQIQYGANGPMTIAPVSPLPFITADRVTIMPALPARSWTLEISGANVTSGSGLHVTGSNVVINGVIINGFPGSAIVLDQCAGCSLFYDILGLDMSGTRMIPNKQNGVTVLGGLQIEIDSCTIGGNAGNGVYAIGTKGIFFGLDVIGKQYLPQGSGSLALPNGATGVFLQDVQGARFLGYTIANNGLDGIATSGTTSGVVIEPDQEIATTIYNNGLMPIDLGFDGVTAQGAPVLTTADISNGFMRVVGSVDQAATITVYAGHHVNQYGIADAETSLDVAKVNAGAFELRFALPLHFDPTGQWISATSTITDATSELSLALPAAINNQNYAVTTSADSGAGSLRQAIIDANNGICSENFPCVITLPSGVIAPATPLPAITRSGIIINGGATAEVHGTLTISSANDALAGNGIHDLTISNADGPGIVIDATANSILNPIIANNTIKNNRGDGILVRGNVPFVHIGTFGSDNRMVRNVITGNDGNGVTMQGGFFEFDSNTITGNAIGVSIEAAAQGHLENNTIAFNRDVGLSIAATAPTAFKASIANPIFANGGDAIRQQPTVQPAPVITSVTYDPATKIATIQGTVTPAAAQGWTLAMDFYTSQYPEVGGRGSGEKVLLSTYSVSPVGPAFTFTTPTDIRGLRVSATATPFTYQGFKTTPDIFGQGFEYGTTSEFSRAIPVVTIGCPADVPQILSGSSAPLRWLTVVGATAYNIWRRLPAQTPQIIGTTSGDTFTPPASGEYFVEAMYSQCPSMKSDAVRITTTRQRAVTH